MYSYPNVTAMVCSPHQYTLQKIATPYLPAVNYIEQKNYLQTPAYQSRPQKELYTARQTDLQEMPAYRLRQQYASRYQTNERQQNTERIFEFTAPQWNEAHVDRPNAIPEHLSSSTWQDYGLPLYSAPSVVKEIRKEQPEQKIKREDLMQRIQQELAMMKEGKKVQGEYLCAA